MENVMLVRNKKGVEIRIAPSADLRNVDLSGADLHYANLTDANLQNADLTDAGLYLARLKGANLIGANLRNANLIGADLRRADLTGADLSNANLSDANLQEADLSRVRLMGADMSSAELDGAVLAFNVWDENTKWPQGFKPFAWRAEEEENEKEEEDSEPFSDPMTEDEINQCKSYVKKNIKDGHWALAELHAEAVSRDTVLKYDAEVYELIAQKAKQISKLIKEISALSVQ
jgi:hypothetical protein